MAGNKSTAERILVVQTYYGCNSNAAETARILSQRVPALLQMEATSNTWIDDAVLKFNLHWRNQHPKICITMLGNSVQIFAWFGLR